jgi:hypothetical protein
MAFDAPRQSTVFVLAAAVIEHAFGGDREPFRQQLIEAIAADPGRPYWAELDRRARSARARPARTIRALTQRGRARRDALPPRGDRPPWQSAAGPPAVYVQGLPGDVAGGVGGQEQQRPAEFPGPGRAAQRRVGRYPGDLIGSASQPEVALGKNDGATAFTRTPRPPHWQACSRARP